jgi:hypothetical protein
MMAGKSSSLASDLSTYPPPPASKAALTTSGSRCSDTNNILDPGAISRIRWPASIPFRPGSPMSKRIKLGCILLASAIASTASATSQTICKLATFRSVEEMKLRQGSKSSTTMTEVRLTKTAPSPSDSQVLPRANTQGLSVGQKHSCSDAPSSLLGRYLCARMKRPDWRRRLDFGA